ncbi:perlucin-like protein [Mytilus californianus]|uniref:perlucin-like protein n=1 Tax=Mytilus californianus TaxID=6549 RepID=UPI0022477B00|nr:perlucin-like protein [Mytilus californianus]
MTTSLRYVWLATVIVVCIDGSVQSTVSDGNSNCTNLKGLKDGLAKLNASIAVAEKTCSQTAGLNEGVAKLNAYLAAAEKTCTLTAECPVDWILHGNSCYYFSYDLTTWSTATIECQNKGGYLVEVDNDRENAWLVSKLKDEVWIGLTDIQTEGRWRWQTGSPSTYSNWQSGEPNGGTGQNCAHYCATKCHKTYVGWNDGSCTVPIGYICEKNLHH